MINKKLHKKVHEAFKLNGRSFKNSTELLSYVRSASIEGLEFLESWFDKEDFITAHTSGSTGTPKKIKLKKQQLLNSAKATGNYFNSDAGTIALLCMSSGFIAGKMMWVRALSLGWELDVVATNAFPLEKITRNYDFVAMVPLQVSNSIAKLHTITTLIIGGGVVSNELKNSLQSLSTNVFATYGMTETVTHIAVRKLNHIQESSERYYKLLPSVSIETDERGCLIIDAPLVSDKKVVTNDLVALISKTSFEWLGRYDSVINSGGVKLIPEQIEKKISKVISEKFFIAGVVDSLLGEKVILLIESNENSILDKTEIKEYLKHTLLKPYEIPKEIHFLKAFELTATGKIKRTAVLEKLD